MLVSLFHGRLIVWAMCGAVGLSCLPSFSAAAKVQPGAAPTDELADVAHHKIVDLTQILKTGSPEFHGKTDVFQYKRLLSVEKDGYAIGSFCTPEHYGTHVDAPCHFLKDGKSIDEIPASQLLAPCVVIDVRDEVKANPDYELTLAKVKQFEQDGVITAGSAVLLLTGWSDRWASCDRYRNADSNGQMHFPGFGAEAATYLVNERHCGILGIDTLSIDRGMSQDYRVHHLALSHGLMLIENLNNIAAVPERRSLLICAPLPISKGTGSPARVLAILP